MKKIYFSVFLVLLVIPAVFAIDTEIELKTNDNIPVTIRILNQESKILDPVNGIFNEVSDGLGKVSVIFSSDERVIKMSISLKGSDESRTIFINDLMPTGGKIYIDITKESPVPVITSMISEQNETLSNKTEETASNSLDVNIEVTNTTNESIGENLTEGATQTQNQSEEVNKGFKGVTGAVIDGTKAVFSSRITYYIIGGIFILGVLFFAVFIARKKLGKKRLTNFKVTLLSEIKSGKSHDRSVEDAEKKLEEAKKQLEEIKNRKIKIEEAKRKLEEDKKELDRLERGN